MLNYLLRRKGNDKGEIVTSCRLSGLIVEKDNEISEKESSSNPARRLYRPKRIRIDTMSLKQYR